MAKDARYEGVWVLAVLMEGLESESAVTFAFLFFRDGRHDFHNVLLRFVFLVRSDWQ